MNKFLLIIVMILIPINLLVKEKEIPVMMGVTLENYSLEVKPKEEIKEEEKENEKVLISNNKDKSNPFYVDLEEYVIGVVAGEMPASFNIEALKAQAVASRSFALNKMQQNNNYVLSTTINDQVYLTEEEMHKKWGNEFDYYYNRIKQAVLDTKGEVVTYNDEVISAYYFAISNGYTDDAQVVFNESRAYLVSVDSSWDKNYKSYSSTRTLTKNDFLKKLGLEGNTIKIGEVIRSDNNYVRSIVINDIKFTGLEVFNKLALKSTDFVINVNNDNVNITTYGFGHSVGMSQYGAQGMASEGYNYQDILKHYYKNTEINYI